MTDEIKNVSADTANIEQRQDQVEKTTENIITQTMKTRPYTAYLLRASGRVTPIYLSGDDDKDMTQIEYELDGNTAVINTLIPSVLLVLNTREYYKKINPVASQLANKTVYNDALLVALNDEGYTSTFRAINHNEAVQVLQIAGHEFSKYGREVIRNI